MMASIRNYVRLPSSSGWIELQMCSVTLQKPEMRRWETPPHKIHIFINTKGTKIRFEMWFSINNIRSTDGERESNSTKKGTIVFGKWRTRKSPWTQIGSDLVVAISLPLLFASSKPEKSHWDGKWGPHLGQFWVNICHAKNWIWIKAVSDTRLTLGTAWGSNCGDWKFYQMNFILAPLGASFF